MEPFSQRGVNEFEYNRIHSMVSRAMIVKNISNGSTEGYPYYQGDDNPYHMGDNANQDRLSFPPPDAVYDHYQYDQDPHDPSIYQDGSSDDFEFLNVRILGAVLDAYKLNIQTLLPADTAVNFLRPLQDDKWPRRFLSFEDARLSLRGLVGTYWGPQDSDALLEISRRSAMDWGLLTATFCPERLVFEVVSEYRRLTQATDETDATDEYRPVKHRIFDASKPVTIMDLDDPLKAAFEETVKLHRLEHNRVALMESCPKLSSSQKSDIKSSLDANVGQYICVLFKTS